MDISSFASKLSSSGLQKSSHYQVEFYPPGAVGSVPYGNAVAHCYVKDVSLPGRNISTSEIKYGGEPTTKQAYNSIPNDCTITFMADGDMQIWRHFQQWQRAIHDPQTGAVGYPDDYKGVVKIKTFSVDGTTTHEQSLQDAFPENLSDIQLTYGAEELATFSVTFSYTRIEEGSGIGGVGGATPGLALLGGIIQAIANPQISFTLGPISGRLGF